MTASGNAPKVGYKQKMTVGKWQISGFLLFLKYEWILQGGERGANKIFPRHQNYSPEIIQGREYWSAKSRRIFKTGKLGKVGIMATLLTIENNTCMFILKAYL